MLCGERSTIKHKSWPSRVKISSTPTVRVLESRGIIVGKVVGIVVVVVVVVVLVEVWKIIGHCVTPQVGHNVVLSFVGVLGIILVLGAVATATM